MDPRDIRIWEATNPIRVNVLGWDGLFYVIKNDGDSYERMVNLLFIRDLLQSHYVAITDLDTLLSSEVNSDSHHKHHCSNCLRMFYSESSRDEHHAQCTGDPNPVIVMPHPNGLDNILKFEHIDWQLCHLRILYTDTETIQP